MKRSEALYKIRTILDNLENICTNHLRSQAILNELERSGMLPPKAVKLKKYKETMMELIENVNEWEDI